MIQVLAKLLEHLPMPILNVNPIVSKHFTFLSTHPYPISLQTLTISKHLDIQPLWVPDIETLAIGTLPLPAMANMP
jgi:hypothetical protein